MVLVRRKSDGKFYTNRGASRAYYRHQDGWTDNPSECKPFQNERGARWSFHYYIPRKKNCPHFTTSTSEWSAHVYKHYDKNCECEKARRQAVRDHFDSLYEVVPVRMEVKL